jgi:hypothetical protein
MRTPRPPWGKGGEKEIKKKLKNSWKNIKRVLPLHMYHGTRWKRVTSSNSL